jgi:hypothetical protein
MFQMRIGITSEQYTIMQGGGSRSSVDEDYHLLGYYAVSAGKHRPWWWRHHSPMKCCQLFANQHGITSQMTWIFRFLALHYRSCGYHIAPLEEQCHNSKNAHFELCPQEVCLRPYLPSGIGSHVYFLKWPREGRSVGVLLSRLHRPGQWFFLFPEKLYFLSCDSVLLGVRYVLTRVWSIFNAFGVPCEWTNDWEILWKEVAVA